MTVTIDSIKRTNGVAGQFSYTATGTMYEEPYTLTFTGSAYGGPIVMITGAGTQAFVSAPERFGPALTEDWVRAFITTEQ
jgi:hypothetical protein